VAGVIGRDTGLAQLFVLEDVSSASLEGFVGRVTRPDVTLYGDEWGGYAWVAASGRGHATVCHTAVPREWARDDDGDGVREVHNNTCEGLWTGLRNFLRPFRGVNKVYLYQYAAIFEWGFNIKCAAGEFIRALLGVAARAGVGSALGFS
jgi:ISXO2 transposase-like protein